MGFIAEWLDKRVRRWLRARGLSVVTTPAEIPPETPATIARAFLEGARDLLLRGKHAPAVVCLRDALAADAAAVLAIAPTFTADNGGIVAACLQSCLADSDVSPPTDPTVISVIICSRDDARFDAVCAEYERVLAGGPCEIIRIPDARSLTEGYNRGFIQSRGEVVIFSHDDIRFLTANIRAELVAALDEFDMVGVAGATQLAGPTWFSCLPEYRRELVCYPPSSRSGECLCSMDGPQDERW